MGKTVVDVEATVEIAVEVAVEVALVAVVEVAVVEVEVGVEDVLVVDTVFSGSIGCSRENKFLLIRTAIWSFEESVRAVVSTFESFGNST